MIKIAFITVLVLCVTVQGCRFNCPSNVPRNALLCATVKEVAATCHLVSRCHLNAENCNRRMLNRPVLSSVAVTRCRYIRKPNSSGPCAKLVMPTVRPTCKHLKCLETSKATSCYRSKKNNCRLLRNCQMQRLNCNRGHWNRVEWVDPRRCHGLRAGQVLRCRSVPK